MKRRRPTLRARRGAVLLEILLATAIVAIGMTALMAGYQAGLRAGADAQERERVQRLTDEVFQRLRAHDLDPAQSMREHVLDPDVFGRELPDVTLAWEVRDGVEEGLLQVTLTLRVQPPGDDLEPIEHVETRWVLEPEEDVR